MQRKNVTLGASDFVLTPIPPFVALAMFGDLQKLALPVLADAIASKDKDGEDDLDIADMLRKASQALDGKALMHWADRLLGKDWTSYVINGQAVPLDEGTKALAFSDPGQILELMVEVLVFNFEGPIRSFAGRFGNRIGQSPKA